MPIASGQNPQLSLFDLARGAMSAQLVRMNAAASNLANAGSVSGSEAGSYRPIRAVFAEQLDQATGLVGVRVAGIMRDQTPAVKEHNPDHPLADAEGNVWTSSVDENAETVEMLEASRQYQNMVEALSTAKQLMLDTIRMK
jgi:flagellar basal-body rod protein FlgC